MKKKLYALSIALLFSAMHCAEDDRATLAGLRLVSVSQSKKNESQVLQHELDTKGCAVRLSKDKLTTLPASNFSDCSTTKNTLPSDVLPSLVRMLTVNKRSWKLPLVEHNGSVYFTNFNPQGDKFEDSFDHDTKRYRFVSENSEGRQGNFFRKNGPLDLSKVAYLFLKEGEQVSAYRLTIDRNKKIKVWAEQKLSSLD